MQDAVKKTLTDNKLKLSDYYQKSKLKIHKDDTVGLFKEELILDKHIVFTDTNKLYILEKGFNYNSEQILTVPTRYGTLYKIPLNNFKSLELSTHKIIDYVNDTVNITSVKKSNHDIDYHIDNMMKMTSVLTTHAPNEITEIYINFYKTANFLVNGDD